MVVTKKYIRKLVCRQKIEKQIAFLFNTFRDFTKYLHFSIKKKLNFTHKKSRAFIGDTVCATHKWTISKTKNVFVSEMHSCN